MIGVAGDLYACAGSSVALVAPRVVIRFSDERSCRWVVASKIVREFVDWKFEHVG
ncbi:hypothetical protein ACOBQX_20365 [Actinokineospora sp. G85]|uniref:hypothetical protein n=1 Tax=Actinokineospora sp. G85 TaxID=3406626 RepID=UPI003C788095